MATKPSMAWYTKLNRSPLSPPSYVFSIVWPILYILMFAATYRVWTSKKCNMTFCFPVVLFFIHFVFNLSWTTLFFQWKRPDYALLDIILMMTALVPTTYYFYKSDKIAAYLLVPYILWLCFALYLNAYIVIHN
jgi:benzodiazapine receptor